MSERKANEKTVAEAIKTIQARGETVTNEKIKEITGGSLDTIMRVRRELEQKVVAAKDSPEALAHFRLFYRSAYDDGYSARQPELDAFTGQVVQLIQERDAGRGRERDLIIELESLRVREAGLQNELTSALRDSKAQAVKLEALLEELGGTKDRLHRLELDVVSAPVQQSKPVLRMKTHSPAESTESP
jgi:hypothetical protein